MSKEYEVLKFVTRGERCYVGTDYIRGEPMLLWLKHHSCVPKEQLYRWMQEMIGNLACFHKVRGNPCYQYVNPYSMIVDEEGKVHLLDLGSRRQEELLLKMQRRGIRENFLSPENQYYQKASVEEDIYGLGRTFQYMLSTAEAEPPLSGREAASFRKFISRCLNKNSKKRYHTVREISEHFPGKREKKEKKRYLLYIAALVVIIAGAAFFLKEKKEVYREHPAETKVRENKTQKEDENFLQNYETMIFDMGLLYFWEMKDYQKSREIFGRLEESGLASDYALLCEFLLNPETGRPDRELEQLLARIEEELPEEKAEGDIRYYLSILKGYEILDNEDAEDAKIRLAGKCIAMEEWKASDTGHEKEKYLKKALASAYDKTAEWESAVQQYSELLAMEEEPQERVKLFHKIAVLYDKLDKVNEAIASCKAGLEETGTPELANLLIRLQCAESSIDRQICAETIKKCLNEIPELAESEEFKKLQQEYEIRIGGEQVWVGR